MLQFIVVGGRFINSNNFLLILLLLLPPIRWRDQAKHLADGAELLGLEDTFTDNVVKDWRNESFSHFRIEKLLSIDVVFAKVVARPPQNDRR
jgi:hypothetical protein